MVEYRYRTFNSEYGEMLILWKLKNGLPSIHRVCLGAGNPTVAELCRDAREQSCRMVDATVKDILLYLSGEVVDFDFDSIDIDACSGFQRKVLLTECDIPRGCVSTYKRIADRINRPNAARAVGNALAQNPFPIVIPCHRVIRSDGSLGGYGGGTLMKYQLLKMEGIRFDKRRNILPGQLFY